MTTDRIKAEVNFILLFFFGGGIEYLNPINYYCTTKYGFNRGFNHMTVFDDLCF